MVEIKNYSAGYDAGDVVKNASATFNDFEITVLVGPNGSGKSTLIEGLIGLNKKTSGSILIDGIDSDSLSLQERACRIAYMAQIRPVSNISVERLVLHGRFPHLKYPRKYGKQDYMIVNRSLKAVHADNLKKENMQFLSGGQRQRAYIAMALAQETPNIFMDEPMNFLDICHQIELKQLTRELAENGKAVVIVMHDLCSAIDLADKVIVLDDGIIKFEGSPENALKSNVFEEVFHVRIGWVDTGKGKRYYYDI